MAYPPTIQAILDGGPVNPDDFETGHGVPTATTFPQGTLYVDLDTKDVYEYSSGAAFTTDFAFQFQTGAPKWTLVWNMGDYLNLALGPAVKPGMTIEKDISFIAGDAIHGFTFFFPGICYTLERPADPFATTTFFEGDVLINVSPFPDPSVAGSTIKGMGIDDNTTVLSVSGGQLQLSQPTLSDEQDITLSVLIDDPDPDNPFNMGTLPVPWVQRAWYAQIRNTYVSTIRYHNGWVPWYGTWPNWTWWDQYSLSGSFSCVAEWDPVRVGTLVTLNMTSAMSNQIRPLKSYRWDMESAHPIGPDANGNVIFDEINTWVRGNCAVLDQYTRTPV